MNNLPDSTRIWIYQSDRNLTSNEVESIRLSAAKFVKNWAAHGQKLDAAIEVVHQRFIILFANEQIAKASGCSIDSSVKWLTEQEQNHSISLLNNKMQVAYKNGEEIQHCELNDLSSKVTTDTLVFNNLITTKGELENQWLISAKKSWHSKYLSAIPN